MKRPFVRSPAVPHPPPITVTTMVAVGRNKLTFTFSNGMLAHVTAFVARPTGEPIGLARFLVESNSVTAFDFIGELDQQSAKPEEQHRLAILLPHTEPRMLARFWRAILEHIEGQRDLLLKSGTPARKFPAILDRALAIFDAHEAQADYAMLAQNASHRAPLFA